MTEQLHPGGERTSFRKFARRLFLGREAVIWSDGLTAETFYRAGRVVVHSPEGSRFDPNDFSGCVSPDEPLEELMRILQE